MRNIWSTEHTNRTRILVSEWVGMRAIESNPKGLESIHKDIQVRFEDLGFTVNLDYNEEAPYRPLITAIRESNPEGKWLGFWGHYDVEAADESEWKSDPWHMTDVDGRWIGRGVGDNLVPLAQRLILFEQSDPSVNIAYFLQGEEEIGSPYAEQRYGSLETPPIDLWIEETGYFYKDGRQRFMILNQNPLLGRVLEKLQTILEEDGRSWTVRHRSLNKAFGADRCPCLNHLLKNTPYLAIGPNDDHCSVHGADESLDPKLLSICAKQLKGVIEVMSS
ncbi:MAG: peptidase M20 [Euryarchaeota archaeon]|nr:peptidase M20 [Euryarchaeota archaeon]